MFGDWVMTGIILFRAQPFHNGHLAQIRRALCDANNLTNIYRYNKISVSKDFIHLKGEVMKLFIIKVFVLFIRILYAPMKLRKTQNKILWLSRQSDVKSSDMTMLEKAISDLSPETKQIFRLKRLKDESSLSVSYVFSIFGDMWEIASAKIVLVDSST